MEKKFTITESESGQRIDALAAKKFPEMSRSQWQKRGKFKKLRISNDELRMKKTKTSLRGAGEEQEMPGKTRVYAGEMWKVFCTEADTAPCRLQSWDMPLKILADSKSWLAIEKPVEISVHPSPSDTSSHTIVNALLHQFGKKGLSSGGANPYSRSAIGESRLQNGKTFARVPEKEMRPGIVHRLDKVTSGVLLIAKTDAAHRYFQTHWHEVEKTYFALVHGIPPIRGRIEAGIFRDTRDRKKMAVSLHEKSRDAVTHFERMGTCHAMSLLKIKIPTGRTHQIRVHLSSIGFPVVGDEKYGGQKAERVFLHAAKMTFSNPDKKGTLCSVESPVPESFLKF